MGFAVGIQCGSPGIVAKTHGAVLMSDGRQWQALTKIEISRKQALVTFMPVNVAVSLLQCFLQLGLQTIVTFDVVQLVADFDFVFTIHGHTIFRVRQIFGGEPEIQRVFRHQIQRPARRNSRRTGFQRVSIKFAHERNVAHRIFPVLRSEIEIIYCQSLLKDGWVWALRQRHQNRIDVAHVVTADDVRTVSQTIRVTVVRRAQQQCCGVDRAARHDDEIRGIFFRRSVALDNDFADLTGVAVRFQPHHLRICNERDVFVLERRIHTDRLRVRLRVN